MVADAVAGFASRLLAIPLVTVALRSAARTVSSSSMIVDAAREAAAASAVQIAFDIRYDTSAVPDLCMRAEIHRTVQLQLDALAHRTRKVQLRANRQIIVSYAIDCVGDWWKLAGYVHIGRNPRGACDPFRGTNRRC